MKPLRVPSYMSAPIFQSITDAHSFLAGEGSGKPAQARKACVNAQMHMRESHYAAVGILREECSGNRCHSNLNDGPGGAQRGRENMRSRGERLEDSEQASDTERPTLQPSAPHDFLRPATHHHLPADS